MKQAPQKAEGQGNPQVVKRNMAWAHVSGANRCLQGRKMPFTLTMY